MKSTLRLHIFPPTDEEGEEQPPTLDTEDRYALETAFSECFVHSGYGTLRPDKPEMVSEIFEDRPDNMELVAELEAECQRLYPEADVLRVRTDNDRDDGPAWEYREDIIIQVANLDAMTPEIRWQFGEDIFGLQQSPAVGATNGTIPLTNGKTLWGIATKTGEAEWSCDMEASTSRNPTLVNETVIVEGRSTIRGYSLGTGTQRWQIEDAKTGLLTARPIPVDEGCYLGDADGKIYHLSTEGDLVLVCELNARVEALHADEYCVYALTQEPGQSGTTPKTVNSIDRQSETIQWTFTPEERLNRGIVSGSGRVFVSTFDRILALNAGDGDIDWELANTLTEESETDGEERQSKPTRSKNDSSNRTGDAESEAEGSKGGWRSDVEWSSKQVSTESRLKFITQPLFKQSLYAPTNSGLLKIEPETGEIIWQSLSESDEESATSTDIRPSASPPTSDGTVLYIASGDIIYAIELDSGEILWQFETPGEPGAVTYCDTSESVSFVTRGLTVNIDSVAERG